MIRFSSMFSVTTGVFYIVEMRDEFAPDANIRHRPLLLEEIDMMKSYEDFYNNIFKGLTKEESLEVVKAITEKLKVIAIDKGRYEETKENFENIEKITKKLK